MPSPDPEDRAALAALVSQLKPAVAEAVTDEFFRRHPDWLARYGEPGRKRGVEDAGFHMDFLAGALESGQPRAFADYIRWTTRVLASRGMAPHFLVENVEQIRSALLPSLSPGQRETLAAYVEAGLSQPEEGEDPVNDEQQALSSNLYLQAVLRGERRAALGIAQEALREGSSVGDVYCDILQRAQYEVGRLWESNRITVAREHMATAVTQYVIANLYGQIQPRGEERGKAVITGVEGELHQIGANMVADVLEEDGWSVRFLGTSMPHSGILKAVEEHEADVLGISATMLFNIPQVRRLIAEVRQGFAARPPRIIVGGSAFHHSPELWREIGADGYASDLREAVRLARDL